MDRILVSVRSTEVLLGAINVPSRGLRSICCDLCIDGRAVRVRCWCYSAVVINGFVLCDSSAHSAPFIVTPAHVYTLTSLLSLSSLFTCPIGAVFSFLASTGPPMGSISSPLSCGSLSSSPPENSPLLLISLPLHCYRPLRWGSHHVSLRRIASCASNVDSVGIFSCGATHPRACFVAVGHGGVIPRPSMARGMLFGGNVYVCVWYLFLLVFACCELFDLSHLCFVAFLIRFHLATFMPHRAAPLVAHGVAVAEVTRSPIHVCDCLMD